MTTEFQVSKPSPERPLSQEEFTLRIFENPKWSGIVLSVDHNQIGAASVRVSVCNPDETPDDGIIKGWAFKGGYPMRKFRARLIDGAIQLRGRAALEFEHGIAHELLRGRAVFVNLYLEHANAGARVRFPITLDREMIRVKFDRDPDAGIHRGGKVVE